MTRVSISVAIMLLAGPARAVTPIPDTPFVQEYRDFYVAGDEDIDDVRAVAVDGRGNVWSATRAGVFRLDGDAWRPMIEGEQAGPAFAAETDPDGTVWFGTWNGLYRATPGGGVEKVRGIDQPVSVIGAFADGAVALGPHGLWHNRRGKWKHVRGDWPDSPRAVVRDPAGKLWLATGHGLFELDDFKGTMHHWDAAALRSSNLSSLAFAPDGRLLIGGLSGIDVYRDGARIGSITPAEGLPFSTVQSLDVARDGTVWIGTSGGVARYDGKTWSLRHSMRWLPDDDVRGTAFGPDGTAWVATAGGVSAIRRRTMTLEEKEAHYHAITLARKMREPGLVERSRLLTPGDVTTSVHEDDDNDGEYTNHYMVMEALRYAVTRDPQAKANANRAFAGLNFLQTVTGTPGFIARTAVPVSWAGPENENPYRFHDGNMSYTPQSIAEVLVEDPRFKPVEIRWRPSADGQWLWKGDTSSDEITGHFCGYFFYNELVAETEEEKARVRSLCSRVMDYIIDGGFMLRDTDGEPTRWGVWAPEKLFGDMDWFAERNINCTELLSYLITTWRVTGDQKYRDLYLDLVRNHGYAQGARHMKADAPSFRTNIDDSLLALMIPALFACETDPELLALYREGVLDWYRVIANEQSPFYNFIIGHCTGADIGAEACVAFLRDAPLDLIHWTVDNSQREDVRLVRYPEIDHWQLDRLLPASERGVMRWDKNPWTAVQGEDGHMESSGVYWLIPYWLGRYYGYIGAPEE